MFRDSHNAKRFILARGSDDSHLGKVKRRYRQNFEKALIISIAAVILLFRLLAGVNLDTYQLKQETVVFETIDIPEIPPLIEDRPKLKVEVVKELPPDFPEAEEGNIKLEEIEDLLNENKEESKLALASNDFGNFLASSSQLGTVDGPAFRLRDYRADLEGGINLKRGKFYSSANEGDLEIGKTKRTTRAAVSDDARIDLGLSRPNPDDEVRVKEKKPEPTLGISGAPERILTFASSTIGTEDYKLWNKINAELDRLSTGRYGSVPKEIVRMKNGFVIKFAYADGTRQEIHWQNSGNVVIKIIGKSKRTSVQELRRALDSLLTITLAN